MKKAKKKAKKKAPRAKRAPAAIDQSVPEMILAAVRRIPRGTVMTYGEVAEGLIHVHHLRSLSEVGEEYIVDPIADLRPVCPNCHAVLHTRTPPFSIEEVVTFLNGGGRH